MSGVVLVVASFLATGVDIVEALTIVLAAGVTRGWSSSLIGVAAALVVLATVVLVLGPALSVVPLATLRLVVGALLAIFGLQWLRKAILRASGYKALRDEEAAFERTVASASTGARVVRNGLDWYAFTLCFKGVVLEGLEVAFIVVTFGSGAHQLGLAVLGAAAALLVVGTAGLVVHRPLSRVPENTLKFAVGLLLTSFGTFWAAEGAGVQWPGEDAAILGLLVVFTLVSWTYLRLLRRRRAAQELVAAYPASSFINVIEDGSGASRSVDQLRKCVVHVIVVEHLERSGQRRFGH